MEKATRLFDCLTSWEQQATPDLLNAKIDGVWTAYPSGKVREMAFGLAASLMEMGVSMGDGTVEGRDKIGLISAGRPEWVITDLAVQLTGAVLVPLYPNTSTKEIEQILIEAGVKYIFVSTADLCDKVKEIFPHVPSLKAIYTYDIVDGCANWLEIINPVSSAQKEKIIVSGKKITEDDIATIIYTSGTTGRPKGVMLTHKNILSNVYAAGKVITKVPIAERRSLSFLPLNHIFEKTTTYIYLFFGFSIYYAESMDTLGANMREVKPYIFTAVPRVLEKVFERIMSEGNKLTGLKRKIFLWSIKIAEQFEIEGQSLAYKIKLAVADKLVYSKWRAAVGGNVKAIIVGSSACPVRLEKIFTAANIVITEGYGLTETSPVVAVNHYEAAGRRFGTVGPLLEDILVKIADDGEILCKGPNIMAGYYKNPELTAEVLEDGWFHTGDIGVLDSDNFLRITDRKKEIFKTSGGKYIAPTPIENKMKESSFIEQMMVVGAGKKFAAALIVPSYINLKPWCAKNDVQFTTNKNLLKEKKVIDLFQSIVDSYNPEFNHVEQLKKITLLPEEWSIESGELTPTGKMKRKIITEKYMAEIEQMYMDEVSPNAALANS